MTATNRVLPQDFGLYIQKRASLVELQVQQICESVKRRWLHREAKIVAEVQVSQRCEFEKRLWQCGEFIPGETLAVP